MVHSNQTIVYINDTYAHINYRLANILCKLWHVTLFWIITIFILFTGCTNNDEVRILFTGDILLSRNVRAEYQWRGESPWTSLHTLFHEADLVAGNLEGAVGENYRDTPNAAPLTFDINSKDIALLRKAGFNIITIANNHSNDLGERAVERTVDTLIANGIRPVGFNLSPQFFTVKNLVVSVVAINTIPGKNGTVEHIPSVEVMQKLRLARTLSNIVVVSIHWGSELIEWPDKKQRVMAEWLVAQGADVIIGSHPHVVQQPEMIGGKPVFFSLGNHLFDQKYPATKEGLIAEIRIKYGKIYCRGIVTHTRPHSFFPEVINETDYGFEPVATSSLFQAGHYTFRPLPVTGNTKYNLRLQAHSKGKKAWTTPPMSIISIDAAMFDDKNESLFILEKHYSNMDGEIDIRPYVYGIDPKGLYARWRGSALAWPLIDAQISPEDHKTLCALHRGDSFINIDKTTGPKRMMIYEWNGFGFRGITDTIKCQSCRKQYEEYLKH